MTRKELLSSPDYWVYQIQNELFQLIDTYLENNKISRTDFGQKLGVTKGYVSQVLNGSFDHKVSKLVSLAMGTGKVPCITFKDLKQVIDDDAQGITYKQTPKPTILLNYTPSKTGITTTIHLTNKSVCVHENQITNLQADLLSIENGEFDY